MVDSPHPLERNQHGDFRTISVCTKFFYDAPSSSSSPNISDALQSHTKKIVSLKIKLKVWNQSTTWQVGKTTYGERRNRSSKGYAPSFWNGNDSSIVLQNTRNSCS